MESGENCCKNGVCGLVVMREGYGCVDVLLFLFIFFCCVCVCVWRRQRYVHVVQINCIDSPPLTQNPRIDHRSVQKFGFVPKRIQKQRIHMSEKDKCVCDSCRSRSVLYARIDSLIDVLKPNEESERVRDGTVRWVERHLENHSVQT